MKTYAAYNVDPSVVFSALKTAGQPVQEIRYRGPERTTVAFACVCLADSADDRAVGNVLASLSGPKPAWKETDRHIEALAQGVGQRMQTFKG